MPRRAARGACPSAPVAVDHRGRLRRSQPRQHDRSAGGVVDRASSAWWRGGGDICEHGPPGELAGAERLDRLTPRLHQCAARRRGRADAARLRDGRRVEIDRDDPTPAEPAQAWASRPDPQPTSTASRRREMVERREAHHRGGVIAGAEPVAGGLHQLAHAGRRRRRGRRFAGTSRRPARQGRRARCGDGVDGATRQRACRERRRRPRGALRGSAHQSRVGPRHRLERDERTERRAAIVAVAAHEEPGGKVASRLARRGHSPVSRRSSSAPPTPSRRSPPSPSTSGSSASRRSRDALADEARGRSSRRRCARAARRSASPAASSTRRWRCSTHCPHFAEAIRPRPVPAVIGRDHSWSGRRTAWCSAGTPPTRRSGCRRVVAASALVAGNA